jgi:hypothetical protein
MLRSESGSEMSVLAGIVPDQLTVPSMRPTASSGIVL